MAQNNGLVDEETDTAREEHQGLASRFGMVGASWQAKLVASTIATTADSSSTVLILGETGTGKELVARALHQSSRRAAMPFVVVNCGAIPPYLFESELFGHEKGAFTGAVSAKAGRFERAHRGTLFLDEVGELPPDAQSKLLRAIQEREVERVGGTRSIPIDVRLIAATNRDLRARVATGGFRADLFYRLNVVSIELPPLRERREDIPPLIAHIIALVNKKMRKSFAGIDAQATAQLLEYPWPGNIRELQNEIERAMVHASGPLLRAGDFSAALEGYPAPAFVSPPVHEFDTSPAERQRSESKLSNQQVDSEMQALIERALDLPGADKFHALAIGLAEAAVRRCDGNKSRAARLLGVNRKFINRMLGASGCPPIGEPEPKSNASPVAQLDPTRR